MSPFSSAISPSLATCLADLSTFGEIALPAGNAELTFQIDIQPSESPEELWFGLLNLPAESHQPISGFAIRLDLNRGEVWDALNGFGLLGTFETAPPGKTDSPLTTCFLSASKWKSTAPTSCPLFSWATRPIFTPPSPPRISTPTPSPPSQEPFNQAATPNPSATSQPSGSPNLLPEHALIYPSAKNSRPNRRVSPA